MNALFYGRQLWRRYEGCRSVDYGSRIYQVIYRGVGFLKGEKKMDIEIVVLDAAM